MLFQSSRNLEFQTLFPRYLYIFCLFPAILAEKGSLILRQQVFFTHQKIAERSQQVQPVGVLREAAIADLAVAEHLLDVPERMFHF